MPDQWRLIGVNGSETVGNGLTPYLWEGKYSMLIG